MTFDYRGMGDSRGRRGQLAARLRGRPVRWARDYDTAVDALAEQRAGGAALLDRPQPWRAAARLAAQPAPHRRAAVGRGRQRLLARQRAAAAPLDPLLLVCAGAGCDPALRLLPGQAAAQGRRPAARRDAAVAPLVSRPALPRRRGWRALSSQFEQVRFPVVALSFTDDEFMSERGTACWSTSIPVRRARSTHRTQQTCRPRIGHFGFFRDQFQSVPVGAQCALLQGCPILKDTTA